MEFVVQKENLLAELTLIQGVVERKTTMPILSNVLLQTGPEGISVMATDLDVGLKTRCEAAVSQKGEVSVQARKLFDIVRSLPAGEIQFRSLGDLDLGIECEQARFKLRGLRPADFPPICRATLEKPVLLPAADLREMIARVAFAVTVDDPVYSLNGALLAIEEKMLTLVATDGHRLAYVSRELELEPVSGPIRRVVHRKTLTELLRLLAQGGEGETVSCGEVEQEGQQEGIKQNLMMFRFERSVLTSRFLEKTFPAYEKVLPSFNDHILTVEREALSEALKRVSILSSERSKAVRFKVSPGKLEVSSSAPELGEASEVVSVEYEGQEVVIGFNARYVLDFLEAVEDSRVRLTLKDAKTQGLFTPDGEHPYDYRYVVMPMQIRGEQVS